MRHMLSSGSGSVYRSSLDIPPGVFPRVQRAFTLFELLLVVAIFGVLAAIAIPGYQIYLDKAKVAQAKTDIVVIESSIVRYYVNRSAFPDTLAQVGAGGKLDPWGNPYQYLNITTTKGKGQVRKDRNLVPINSDFDLYSMGKDGDSVAPLTAKASHDDIIRARDGQFVGLASDF